MSILESVSSAIEPEDLHRVKAVAAAILKHQGFDAEDLLDLVARGEKPEAIAQAVGGRRGFFLQNTGSIRRAEAAVNLAACIVNFLRDDFGIDSIDVDLLQALRREANL